MKIIRYPYQLENFRSSLYDVEHFRYLSTVCKRNTMHVGIILKDLLRISIIYLLIKPLGEPIV